MDFVSAYKMRAEYRIIHIDGKNQLHHIVCSRPLTLVVEWPENFPGGFSIDTLHDSMEDHEHIVHKRYIS